MEYNTVSKEIFFQTAQLFPVPIVIFAPDGTAVFVNQTSLEEYNISGPDQIVGKYNLLLDPVVNDKLGLQDYVRRAFEGEILSVLDVKAPFDELFSRYSARSEAFDVDALYKDIISFPLWNEDGSIAYIATVSITTRMYQGRSDIAKVKEYIEAHWMEEWSLDGTARIVHLSRHHFSRFFKKHTGMTPYSYYQEIKLKKLKEALWDTARSVTEAFNSCGIEYSGSIAKEFKKRFGMTPTQYRQMMADQAPAHDEKPQPALDDSDKQGAPGSSFPHSFGENIERLYQVLECFPLPINVFTPDGTVVFANRSILEMWNISEPAQIVGKYNLRRDSVVNDRLGLNEYAHRALRGETVLVPEVRVPLEDFSVWYAARNPHYDVVSMYVDILNFPVHDERGRLAHVVSVFLTKRIYQGQADIAKAKEYIENHWLEEFDIDQASQAVHLNRYYLSHLFKRHTGMTPYSYYQDIKIRKLKETLCDKNLSVHEAFAACGLSYHGNFVKIFKEKVGMSPSKYRKSIT